MTPSGNTVGHYLCEHNYALIRESSLVVINSFLKANKIKWLCSYDIESIISDVFYKVLEKGHTFDPVKASFKTWVKTIAYHEVINYFRGVRSADPIEWQDSEGDLHEIDELSTFVTPFDVYVANETEERFDSKVRSKTEFAKAVYKLHRIGYKPGEIAKILGTSANSVSIQIFKLRSDLKEAV